MERAYHEGLLNPEGIETVLFFLPLTLDILFNSFNGISSSKNNIVIFGICGKIIANNSKEGGVKNMKLSFKFQPRFSHKQLEIVKELSWHCSKL